MSPKLPISVVIITLNAARHLEAVLAALNGFAEVLILDSGSTDDTQAIAESHGATWHTHPFDDYGQQKQRAVELAANNWILSVDADEVLDQTLCNSLREIDWEGVDPRQCWSLRRINYIAGRPVLHGSWNPEWVLRVFHRHHASFSAKPIHEAVRAASRPCRLAGILHHYSYDDYAALFRPDYHRLKSGVYHTKGRRVGVTVLTLRAAWAFLRSWIMKCGFLDGRAGFVVALSSAVAATVGLAMASDDQVEWQRR